MIFYNRTLLPILRKTLFQKPILILYGARQVGKSTLVKQLWKEDFPESGIFFSCDDTRDRMLLEHRLTSELLGTIGSARLVIIDEAQMVHNIGLTLKLLADNLPPTTQIIATGSSSFELANKIHEPLTGRNRTLQMFPLTVSEYIQHVGLRAAEGDRDRLMLYGMYPSVITASDDVIREKNIRDIARDYVYKDILAFDGIRASDVLVKLVTLLALRVGSEISYADLAKHLGKSRDTIFHYVTILEQAFIVFRVTPFATNREKEVTKSHKIYFYDTGLRNALISNFDPLDIRTDSGAVFENFCMAEIYKKEKYADTYSTIHFWKSYTGSEVDIVISDRPGHIRAAYECKFSKTSVSISPLWKSSYGTKVEVLNQFNVLSMLVEKEPST